MSKKMCPFITGEEALQRETGFRSCRREKCELWVVEEEACAFSFLKALHAPMLPTEKET